jgi:hypothetical protein
VNALSQFSSEGLMHLQGAKLKHVFWENFQGHAHLPIVQRDSTFSQNHEASLKEIQNGLAAFLFWSCLIKHLPLAHV